MSGHEMSLDRRSVFKAVKATLLELIGGKMGLTRGAKDLKKVEGKAAHEVLNTIKQMDDDGLAKFFEHNNLGNCQIVEVALTVRRIDFIEGKVKPVDSKKMFNLILPSTPDDVQDVYLASIIASSGVERISAILTHKHMVDYD